jgi:hypothetical protein
MKSFPRVVGFALALMLAALVGCGSPGIPRPPSLDLPQPAGDLRVVRKGDRVYLAWTVPTETTDGTTLRHLGATSICRSLDVPMKECSNPAGQVAAAPTPGARNTQPAAKVQANYVDVLPASILSGNPEAQLFYSVSIMNQRGRSAGLSNIVSVPAYVSTPPPADFQAKLSAEGVTLTWSGLAEASKAEGIERAYRVYRREEGSQADSLVGEVLLGATSNCRLLDQTFEWEKKYEYHATIVTRIYLPGKPVSQFEGDDSAVVQVFAHDVFPPAVPSGLQAVFSGAGQQPFIDLIWAPDTDTDLAGYNIYRHEAGGATARINMGLVKPPAFRDSNVASGHTYVYTVTAVDVRGNESAPSGEAGETVP